MGSGAEICFIICITEGGRLLKIIIIREDGQSLLETTLVIANELPHEPYDSVDPNLKKIVYKSYVKPILYRSSPRVIRLGQPATGYLVSLFKYSGNYRNFYLKSNSGKFPGEAVILSQIIIPYVINIEVTSLKAEIDYLWGKRVLELVEIKKQVDSMMYVLSTLGGAFSALGDKYYNCAATAGKLSIHQYKLACKVNDPLLKCQCALFYSLSQIQLGNYGLAKAIIWKQYRFVKSFPSNAQDQKTLRMCQGIWAKLKYCCKLHKQRTSFYNNEVKLNL